MVVDWNIGFDAVHNLFLVIENVNYFPAPIEHEAILQWKKNFNDNPKNLLAQNACAKNDPFELSISKRHLQNTHHVFTHKVNLLTFLYHKSTTNCKIKQKLF